MLLKLPSHQLSQVPWLMIPSDNINETHEGDTISHEGKFYVSYSDGEIWVWWPYFPAKDDTVCTISSKEFPPTIQLGENDIWWIFYGWKDSPMG